jgi:hypothetical protein
MEFRRISTLNAWDCSTCDSHFGNRACRWREPIGKPDAGNPLVRFDEGEG